MVEVAGGNDDNDDGDDAMFLDETYQFQQNGFCVKTLYLYFSF